jgi:hypothetical protein
LDYLSRKREEAFTKGSRLFIVEIWLRCSLKQTLKIAKKQPYKKNANAWYRKKYHARIGTLTEMHPHMHMPTTLYTQVPRHQMAPNLQLPGVIQNSRIAGLKQQLETMRSK